MSEYGSISYRHPKEYDAWRGMLRRCYNPKCEKYPRYGGRGIQVCDRWLKSVDNFVVDVGLAPSPKHSIDRIDNNGNYEPGNVHWTTNRKQCLNFSANRPITHQGRTQTIGEWAKELGIKRTTLRMRLDVYGWTVEQAFAIKPTCSGRPTDVDTMKRKAVGR